MPGDRPVLADCGLAHRFGARLPLITPEEEEVLLMKTDFNQVRLLYAGRPFAAGWRLPDRFETAPHQIAYR